MKRFFFIMAAMLLSMGAFAQTESEEPLKGDVNGDGTVDVADIVSVIKIMQDGGGAVGEKMCYWYVGTNNGSSVEPDNFTDVASRIPESEIPETGTVTANGNYVYFVMPDTRHLESVVDEDGSAIEFSYTDVMGYHIYATADKINGQIKYRIEPTVYYWYVGATQPTALPTSDSGLATGTNSGWRKIGTTKPIAGTVIFDGMSSISISSSKVTQYFAINSEVNLGFYDSLGNEDTEFVTNPTVSNGMNIYTSTSKSKTFDSVIKIK